MIEKVLAQKKCTPCGKGTPPIPPNKAGEFLGALPGWSSSAGAASISREYVMKDFSAAVELIRRIAEIAEAEDHHPDMHLTGYRKLKVELATHSIGGLSENDFILAAKINELPKELKR